MSRAFATWPRVLALFALVLSPTWLRADRFDRRVEKLNKRGIEHHEARRYHQAIAAFREALELAPESANVRSNLANAYSGLGVEFLNAGETKAARKAFEDALSIGQDFYAHFGLGYVHYTQNEDREARMHLTESMSLRPEFSRAPRFLALIDYRSGQEARAIGRMARAAELDPSDREAALLRDRWRAEAKIVRTFKEHVTERFRIRHAPKLGGEFARKLAGHLESGYAEIGRALGVAIQPRPRRKLVVGIFDEKSFRQATGTRHWVGGLFDGQIKVAIDAAKADASRHGPAVRALRHELTHALVYRQYPGCPNWLNEGVAQYFEFLPRAGAPEFELERWNEWRDEITATLSRQRARRLAFSSVPARLWELSDVEEARWTYLQGLGFVDHLAARYGLFRVRILLENAHELGSLQGAFERTYGMKLEALEDAWWRAMVTRSAAGSPASGSSSKDSSPRSAAPPAPPGDSRDP